MKARLIVLLIGFGWAGLLWGQQEDQFTQFMNYRLGFNPAYAGSTDGASLSAMIRSQWLGLEGAPQTQLVSFTMPLLNNRIGVGGNIIRSTFGVTEQFTVDAAYTYRFPVPRGYLGIGLQASVRLLRINFNQLQGTQPISIDGAVPAGIQSKYVPNFGAGLYYNSERMYLGISIPRLLNTNIDLADDDGVISREVTHGYLMGGVLLDLSGNLKLQPQVLVKYVQGAPLDADINFSLVIMEQFTAGLTYRIGGSRVSGIGESVAVLTGFQIGENLQLGMAYDLTLSELRNYNSGSIEAMVRYFFQGQSKGEEFENPRIFFDD